MSSKQKILLIDSSYPINVRNAKILNSIRKLESINAKFCTWNRTNTTLLNSDKEEFVYNKTSVYGNKFKKLVNIFSFAFFVNKTNIGFQPDVIIASHWDTFFISFFVKKNSQKLIYEVLDMPTSSNYLIRRLLRLLEVFFLKRVDTVIVASRFFEPNYTKYVKSVKIIENKPYVKIEDNQFGLSFDKKKPTIIFLGTVRYLQIMKNMIDAAKITNVNIEIWGNGPDEMLLRSYAKGINNVKFFGRYEYSTIASIYSKADAIWAVYPSKDYNVKYAISNKYHECLVYTKPGIFASETALGNLVSNQKIGFVVDAYNKDEIVKLFNEFKNNPNLVKQYEQNLVINTEPKYWENIEHELTNAIIK